jgi:hypothetical protein
MYEGKKDVMKGWEGDDGEEEEGSVSPVRINM